MASYLMANWVDGKLFLSCGAVMDWKLALGM